MGARLPIVLIVIGILLAVIPLLAWRMQREEKPRGITGNRKKAFFSQFIAGIVVALVAAGFMFDGDILGENTSGISTVIGIIGLSLIATSNVHLLPFKRR